MTISTVSSVPYTSPVSTATPTTAPSGVDRDGDGDGGGAKVSKYGQLMSQLQNLEQSDPAKAKQVLGEIASKLSDAAKQAGGDRGKMMSALADKFQQAAQTGDLSGLKPPASGAPHGGHHHGHHKATASYSAAQASTSASPADVISSVLAGS